MESISQVSRREMLRSVFWFKIRTRIYVKNYEEICNHFSSFEMRKRNLNIFSNFEKRKRNFANNSHDSRGDRYVEISNFL